MKNLKRYDLNIVNSDNQIAFFKFEDDEGGFMLADDVLLREESRKLTVKELQAQFEKLFCGKFSKHENENYTLDATRTAWDAYLSCAMKNNLLKDSE